MIINANVLLKLSQFIFNFNRALMTNLANTFIMFLIVLFKIV